MMANAMVVSGLMERRGRGRLTMRHTMRRFNGTEPELLNDERNRFVRVTFEPGGARCVTRGVRGTGDRLPRRRICDDT